ncbi:MAG: flippase [Actinobacteria bacterium]|nr:flippase [Actinomycetota bacterium]
MNKVQRIAKNISMLFISRIISMLFGFFYVMYMARYLGPSKYGIIAFALALNGIFGVIVNFGLDFLIVREVARNKNLAGIYLANAMVLKVIFGVVSFLIVAFVVNILGYPETTIKVVYLITISTTIAGIVSVFRDIYQAFEEMVFIAAGQILSSVLSLILVLVGIKLQLGVIYFAVTFVLVNLIVLGYYVGVTIWKHLHFSIHINFNFWKHLVSESWSFALSSIFVAIFFWIDSVMLSYMKGNEIVGIYNAAYRLVYVLLFIPGTYFMTIYPVLSKMYMKSQKDVKFVYNRSLKYFATLGGLIGIVTMLFAKEIILLIYGQDYELSIPALKILIWAVVFSFVTHPPLYTLNSINRQIVYTKATALGALLNFILNIFAIQKLSYIGASLTTVFTEALVFSITFMYLKAHLEDSLSSYMWIVKLIVTIFFSLSLYYLALIVVQNTVVLFILYGLAYSAGVILFRIIDDIDINLLRQVFRGGS